MKNLMIALCAATLFTACQQSKNDTSGGADSVQAETKKAPSPDAPVISFESGMYNFGKIVQGEKVNHEFKFTNTGKTPLIITDATATCGCTTPELPKAPVKPGESGVIKVVFNSTGKMGMQDKVVTITSNANPEVTEVHLIGEVQEPSAK